MDHMRRGTIRLEKIKMVILDEADVMLNMGFREDIETILKDAPKERQTVFFSATMPRPIRDLIEKFSREPQTVKIEQKAMTVPTVEQVYYEVDRRFKVDLLTRLIDIYDLKLASFSATPSAWWTTLWTISKRKATWPTACTAT